MAERLLRFSLIVFLSLVVGTTFGLWLGFNPAALSFGAYVEQQQNAIRAMNIVMPILGAFCIILTVLLAVLARSDRIERSLLFAAAALLVCAALVTRFGNQPINAIVMTYSVSAPPPNWSALRDQWWLWHEVRTVAGLCALILVLLAVFLYDERDKRLE